MRIPVLLLASAALLSAGPVNSPPMIGINLSGAEFGDSFPGSFGTTYTYPGAADLDYYKARGFDLIRLPFRWERIQPQLEAPLDRDELDRLDAFLDAVETRGMRVVPDMHNYARYNLYGQSRIIGSPDLPRSAFADVWARLADHLKDRDCIWGYGIMNEPHDLGPHAWPESAQAAIDGIRRFDTRRAIVVPGDIWSGAHRWRDASAGLDKLKDPANNLIFEAHQYFDHNHSGFYKRDYRDEGASPSTGVDRTRDYFAWLRAKRARGFIGEYGVPDDDRRWLVTLDRMLARMKAEGVSGAYWSGGPWWGGYKLAVGLRPGHDEAPQMAVLAKYVDGPGTRHWPAFYWLGDVDARRTGPVEITTYESKDVFTFLDTKSHDAAREGATGLYFDYKIPAGGHAGLVLETKDGGGTNLARNLALGHDLVFHVNGTAGSSLGLMLVAANGARSAPVDLADHATLDGAWHEIRIPFSRLLAPGFTGNERITRLLIEGRPADGRLHTLKLDEIRVDQPRTPPVIDLRLADARASFPLRTAIEAVATAQDSAGGPVDFVEFILNGDRVAVSRAAPHTARITPPVAGSYRLYAIAYDRHGNPARTPAQTLVITP